MTSSDVMRELHGAAQRDVQFVDLALPFHVLELPHPLLADDVDLERIVGRTALEEEDAGAPGEHDHGEAEGNHRPDISRAMPPWERGAVPVRSAAGSGRRKKIAAKIPTVKKTDTASRKYAGGPRPARRWTPDPEIREITHRDY